MQPDWAEMFGLSVPPLELFLRGTLMYLGIFLILRLLLRRIAGNIAITDLLMVVLIADAAQNGMSADYRSVTDGAVLVSTLVFWNYTLDRLAYHFPWMGRLIHPPPLPIVRDGGLLWRNMRSESITREELLSQMRESGIDKLEKVKLAHVEGDGRVSFVKYE
jgi:uncharacterized membrane protein YcaP (DUF421 family)